MPVERPQQTIEKTTNPETLLSLKDGIMTAWDQLPAEHQATLALTLNRDVQTGAWGSWLAEAMALYTGRESETDGSTFPVISLNREDLRRAFSEETLALFQDQDIKKIAEELREGFTVDPGFWYAVEMTGLRILADRNDAAEAKSEYHHPQPEQIVEDADNIFSSWMNAVDEAVWMIAGCSVHDLPDYSFRALFDDGAAATEAANEALENAGFVFQA